MQPAHERHRQGEAEQGICVQVFYIGVTEPGAAAQREISYRAAD